LIAPTLSARHRGTQKDRKSEYEHPLHRALPTQKALNARWSRDNSRRIKKENEFWERSRFACSACGKRGADVRPDFSLNKLRLAMMDYRSARGDFCAGFFGVRRRKKAMSDKARAYSSRAPSIL
jgi:hypothetical protein